MGTKGRKINMPLKLAIVRSGRSQREIAQYAAIGEVRLSAIVQGRLTPTEEEKDRLARVLGRRVDGLFPRTREAGAA
jgi:transcriptional regulator with XRE-family HTH domain